MCTVWLTEQYINRESNRNFNFMPNFNLDEPLDRLKPIKVCSVLVNLGFGSKLSFWVIDLYHF